MKKKTWKSKLSKAQLHHVKEITDNCLLREFKANRTAHRQWILEGVETEPRWECRMIAMRLGIE